MINKKILLMTNHGNEMKNFGGAKLKKIFSMESLLNLLT